MNVAWKTQRPEDLIQERSDIDLLGEFFGVEAEIMYEACGGSITRVLAETRAAYTDANRRIQAASELVRRALVEEMRERPCLNSPAAVKDYLRLHFLGREYEAFVCLWLDAHHRLIAVEELFRGALTQTAVYPRTVCMRGLACNAAGVLCAHNHPSGIAEPSRADESLTRLLKKALMLVDIKLLDHFVIAGSQVTSFAERGLL